MSERTLVGRSGLYTLVCLLMSGTASAAPDLLRYDGGRSDRAGGAVIDAAGNLYVVGYSERTNGQSSFTVVKRTAQGSVDWVAGYSGASGGTGGSANVVQVDAAGNVYAAGYVYNGGTSLSALDYLVVKFDPSGQELWSCRYNGPGNYYDQISKLVVDAAGNVYVSGQSFGTSFDWATLKYSATGALLWTRRFDGPASQSDDSVVELLLDGSNLLVVGRIGSTSGAFGNDVAAIKYSPTGDVIWTKTFSETTVSDEVAHDADLDASGNLWITGVTTATSSPEQPMFPFLLKYDRNGQPLVSLKTASAGGDAVETDAAGNVFVTGLSSPEFSTPYAAVSKFTPAGTLVWTTPLVPTGTVMPSPYRIAIDSAGLVYVAGITFDLSSDRDFLTIKLDGNGGLVWLHRFGGVSGRNDEVVDLRLDASQNVFVTGTSWNGYVSSGGTAEDFVTLRFANGSVPSAQKPAAPTELRVDTATASRVALRWRDNSTNENGFRIDRCLGNGCANFSQIAQVGTGVTTFSDATVARNTRYTYRVRAFNDAGETASNTVVVQTPKK